MIDIKDLVKLFFVFLKISLLTFGGGYTCLPIMEKELVNKNQLITNDQTPAERRSWRAFCCVCVWLQGIPTIYLL